MILVVDDHHSTANALEYILRTQGYETRVAASGDEALALLSEIWPALIILDHNMPGLTGLEVLARLKKDAQLASIPVLLYSAYGTDDIPEQAIALGAAAHVIKASMDWAQLHRIIEQLLARPSPKTDASAGPASNTEPS
jgi:CheY-like chemotaxis protein